MSSNESIGCDICQAEAAAFIQWGLDLYRQTANLCHSHIEELWERVQPQLKAGICVWMQDKPMSITDLAKLRGKGVESDAVV